MEVGAKRMTDNKKLIKLIGLTKYGSGSQIGKNFQAGFIEKIADHLIANGVTFLEWRNVAEEKPADFVSVLGHMTDAGDFPAVRECYHTDNGFYFPTLRELHPIDKWAYMPEPPEVER